MLTGDAYLHPEVFAHGYRIACVICAISCLIGGTIAATFIRNARRVPSAASVAAGAAEH